MIPEDGHCKDMIQAFIPIARWLQQGMMGPCLDQRVFIVNRVKWSFQGCFLKKELKGQNKQNKQNEGNRLKMVRGYCRTDRTPKSSIYRA